MVAGVLYYVTEPEHYFHIVQQKPYHYYTYYADS